MTMYYLPWLFARLPFCDLGMWSMFALKEQQSLGTGGRESPGTIQSGIMYIVHQMAAAAVLNPVKEGRFILPGNVEAGWYLSPKLGWGKRCCSWCNGHQPTAAGDCGGGSYNTRSQPWLRFWQKNEGSCWRLPDPHIDGVLWWPPFLLYFFLAFLISITTIYTIKYKWFTH